MILEVISGSQSAAEACRRYSLKPQVLSRWKAEFLDKAAQVFQSDEQCSQEQVRIAEPERLVGEEAVYVQVNPAPALRPRKRNGFGPGRDERNGGF